MLWRAARVDSSPFEYSMNVDFCAHSPRPGNVMLASTSSAAFRRAAIFYALFLAIALGIWLRLSSVLAADFPLNDGGLFWQMAQEIRENGYALPAFTGYNFERIPLRRWCRIFLGFHRCRLCAFCLRCGASRQQWRSGFWRAKFCVRNSLRP
jgi:hypothetical protein